MAREAEVGQVQFQVSMQPEKWGRTLQAGQGEGVQVGGAVGAVLHSFVGWPQHVHGGCPTTSQMSLLLSRVPLAET